MQLWLVIRLIAKVKLTGTPLSSWILYWSNASGLPVRSRTMKNMLAITNVRNPSRPTPIINVIMRCTLLIRISIMQTTLITDLLTNDINIEEAFSREPVENTPNTWPKVLRSTPTLLQMPTMRTYSICQVCVFVCNYRTCIKTHAVDAAFPVLTISSYCIACNFSCKRFVCDDFRE